MIDTALIAGGIALAASGEPHPDGEHIYRVDRLGGIVVLTGAIGLLGTAIWYGASRRPPPR